eukprot:scaffold71262_cov69-Phaeocystis_antarctica.AAC.1
MTEYMSSEARTWRAKAQRGRRLWAGSRAPPPPPSLQPRGDKGASLGPRGAAPSKRVGLWSGGPHGRLRARPLCDRAGARAAAHPQPAWGYPPPRALLVLDALEQGLLRHAEALEVLPRQVDPLAGAVLAHVAQDVGQLQRDAQRQRGLERLLQRRILRGAHDREDHEPHGARHAVAVDVQLVEGVEAVLVEVHYHTLDHVLERLHGQPRVVAHRVDQRQVDRVIRHALVEVRDEVRVRAEARARASPSAAGPRSRRGAPAR